MLQKVFQFNQRRLKVGLISTLSVTELVMEAKGVNGLKYWKWDDTIF